MASRVATTRRSLLTSSRQTFSPTRPFTSLISPPMQPPALKTLGPQLLRALRPLVTPLFNISSPAVGSVRDFSTRHRHNGSSMNHESNRPPKETIQLDGCDFHHWLVVVEKPDESWTRDQIIDSYIKTLAQVVGSEGEARMKIYSVSTRHYFAFGALVPEEVSYKIKDLPGVSWVLPDSYMDVRNKDYGGEPFINGQAVPYDPKYHAEWVRNNHQAKLKHEYKNQPRRRGYKASPPDRNPGFAPDSRASNSPPTPQQFSNGAHQPGPGPNQRHGSAPDVAYQNSTSSNNPFMSNYATNAPPPGGNAPDAGGASHQPGTYAPNQNNYPPGGNARYVGGASSHQPGTFAPTQNNYRPENAPYAGGASHQSDSRPYAPNQNSYAPGNANANARASYQSERGQDDNTRNGNGYAPGNAHQHRPGPNGLNQNSYAPNMAGGNPYPNQNIPAGGDIQQYR